MNDQYKKIHIVSFDIPYPPNYGGIIDVFYKIKTLFELGYEIDLHCFDYKGKEHSDALESMCRNVYYYQRKKIYQVFFNWMPYIVSSRSNLELLNNLKKDNAPILFEGLHTCFYLDHPELALRNKSVWMHNIESDYYQNLSKADKNFIHKIHFSVESKKLKKYENVLYAAQNIFCVNQKDAEYMTKYCKNTMFVPLFHLNETVDIINESEDYILYHGSLDVVENNQAIVWLISTVFSKLPYKVIIAGKNPKESLVKLIKNYPHISLKSNVSKEEMKSLIQKAQANVLISFQSTGLKQKVLNALYNSKHVIVNDKIVANSGLESLCQIANTPEELIHQIKLKWHQPIDIKEIESRKLYLDENYSNLSNVKKIIPHIFV
jgi:hypothetical protein